jgi:hypothetical protein
MARLSPEKAMECEKSLNEHLNEWKKRNERDDGNKRIIKIV